MPDSSSFATPPQRGDEPPSADTSSSFYRRLLDSLYEAVYFVDTERRITYWNASAEELTGYPASEVVGRYCYDNFLRHVNEEGCALCANKCPLAGTIADGERREAEIYLRHKRGHRVPVRVRVAPIRDNAGTIIGAVEVFSDVSAKKTIERRAGELEKLAFTDELTGVSNRRHCELKAEQAIEEVQRFGRNVGLLMIDIDNFKQVNDTYGHKTGDLALKSVCETLRHNLRPGDTVGRWGGEEFLVIAMDVSPAALLAFAERCRLLIAESTFPAGARPLSVTVSLGATLLQTGDSMDSALKRADKALYQSKSSGRNLSTLG